MPWSDVGSSGFELIPSSVAEDFGGKLTRTQRTGAFFHLQAGASGLVGMYEVCLHRGIPRGGT